MSGWEVFGCLGAFGLCLLIAMCPLPAPKPEPLPRRKPRPRPDKPGDRLTSLVDHNDRLVNEMGIVRDHALYVRPAAPGELTADEQAKWDAIEANYDAPCQRTEQP